MQKKVAVILSGCGVYDGAEIHESVLTLLRLDSVVRRCNVSRRTSRSIMSSITWPAKTCLRPATCWSSRHVSRAAK